MKSYVRGATITLKYNFFDADGAIINPSTATVAISYRANCSDTSATYSLSQSGNDWTYDWDSSVADGGRVSTHAAGSGGEAFDRDFILTANWANQDALD
jgi:hypothetical protein